MDFGSIDTELVAKLSLLLLIGLGPKIALVPFLDKPSACRRRSSAPPAG